MIELELGESKRARVWLEDLPADAHFDPENVVVSPEISGRPLRRDVVNSMAVEVVFPTGPMWHYGLLGGTFQPDDTTGFRASVGYRSTAVARDIPWSLSPASGDRVAVGLPLWAARSVAGFLGFSGEDIGPLPSGSLSITHALIAEAGTSAAILEALACCLGALMADAAGVLTNDRVAKIVRDGLRQGFAARR